MQEGRRLTWVIIGISTIMVLTSLAFGRPLPDPQDERGRRGGEQSPEQMLERMSTALNLTDEQKAQIKPILEEQSQQIRTLFADESLTREQKMEKVRGIRETTHKKIKPILTAEQQAKFAEMQKRGRGQRSPKDKGENQVEKKDPDKQ